MFTHSISSTYLAVLAFGLVLANYGQCQLTLSEHKAGIHNYEAYGSSWFGCVRGLAQLIANPNEQLRIPKSCCESFSSSSIGAEILTMWIYDCNKANHPEDAKNQNRKRSLTSKVDQDGAVVYSESGTLFAEIRKLASCVGYLTVLRFSRFKENCCSSLKIPFLCKSKNHEIEHVTTHAPSDRPKDHATSEHPSQETTKHAEKDDSIAKTTSTRPDKTTQTPIDNGDPNPLEV